MTLITKLEHSNTIIRRAIIELQPYAIVMMFSGGDDSLTAYHVARRLEIPIDAIAHIVTGTGIPETTQYVRAIGEGAPERYIEIDAGSAYEEYVMRKGFFGRGMMAHNYAYHLLKATGFRKLISRNFRKGQRGRNILLINGARQSESENRMFTMREPIQRESAGNSNYWVNIINGWTKEECQEFRGEYGIQSSPVAFRLCRSGECMCGTMQSQQEREEAAFWYPHWGKWLDDLESAVMNEFPWRWGEHVPKWWAQQQAGQQWLEGFHPMCSDCVKVESGT